ncbi:MAG: hypothetical protein HQL39_12100 [Alphaproteobacteria bacterium]|nr:hypothetical protein [Alphaproteobacteria bacterium]
MAKEIEALRTRLRDAKPGDRNRARLDATLYDATMRLNNIMALAVFQLSQITREELQAQLSEGINELRDRVKRMSTEMITRRIGEIHDKAAAVLGGAPYPVGLATRLREAYIELTGSLSGIGGVDDLAADERALVQDTSDAIDRLATIEGKFGMLRELDNSER